MSGDIETLVAVKSRDLSSPNDCLGIAEIYQKAGQADRALDWAERGLKAFPERPGNRLRDFLVTEYIKRDDEAVQLTWIQFEDRPTLERYRRLHDVANQFGRWSEQCQRALDWIETIVLREANEIIRWKPKSTPPDWSLRLEIALWETDLDTAWLMIRQGKRRRESLLSSARKPGKSRPGDAVTSMSGSFPASSRKPTTGPTMKTAVTSVRSADWRGLWAMRPTSAPISRV